MKIAIIGSGAIGGYYGACLARAGEDVHFLFRSDYTTVQQKGLHITTPKENFTLPVNAYSTLESIGLCDLIIIALKTTANAAVFPHLKSLIKKETLLLTLQNGLGNVEELAKYYKKNRVLGAACFVCLTRTAPGVIQKWNEGTIRLGEYHTPPQKRTYQLATLFSNAGIDCTVTSSLHKTLWQKLCWNIPFGGLSILGGGISTEAILRSPPLKELLLLLMKEIQGIANGQGILLSDSFLEKQVEVTYSLGTYKPSCTTDFLLGKPIELEAIWGEPLRRAQALPAPYLRTLYLLLKHETQKTIRNVFGENTPNP